MRILKHEKRSPELLKKQFKMVMDHLVPNSKNGYVSGPGFDKICREIFNTSIRPSIRTRFATTSGKNDGFNNLKKQLGYKVQRIWTKQEILAHYYNIHKSLGRQPTENDIIGTSLSMTTVYHHFGTHMKAVDAMFIANNIGLKAVYPPNIRLNTPEKIGEDFSKYSSLGMLEGPVCEQDLVILWAKIHRLIGFPVLEKTHQEFPDCRATCTRGSQHTRANIEFKYLCSATFKKNRRIEAYRTKKIHFLVCWENDSIRNTKQLVQAGIEVISLKEELLKLFQNGEVS